MAELNASLNWIYRRKFLSYWAYELPRSSSVHVPWFFRIFKNKYIRFVFISLTIISETAIVYSWQPFSSMLFADQAYSWKCTQAEIQAYHDSVQHRNSAKYEPICIKQNNSIQLLYNIYTGSEFVSGAFAGIMFDYLGPFLTGVAGHLAFTLGLVALIYSSAAANLYIFSMICLGGAANLIVFSALGLPDYFPKWEGLVVSCIIAFQNGGSIITSVLDQISRRNETPLDSLMTYYICCWCLPLGVVYLASLPLLRSVLNPQHSKLYEQIQRYERNRPSIFKLSLKKNGRLPSEIEAGDLLEDEGPCDVADRGPETELLGDALTRLTRDSEDGPRKPCFARICTTSDNSSVAQYRHLRRDGSDGHDHPGSAADFTHTDHSPEGYPHIHRPDADFDSPAFRTPSVESCMKDKSHSVSHHGPKSQGSHSNEDLQILIPNSTIIRTYSLTLPPSKDVFPLAINDAANGPPLAEIPVLLCPKEDTELPLMKLIFSTQFLLFSILVIAFTLQFNYYPVILRSIAGDDVARFNGKLSHALGVMLPPTGYLYPTQAIWGVLFGLLVVYTKTLPILIFLFVLDAFVYGLSLTDSKGCYYVATALYVLASTYVYSAKFTFVSETYPPKYNGVLLGILSVASGLTLGLNVVLVDLGQTYRIMVAMLISVILCIALAGYLLYATHGSSAKKSSFSQCS